MVRLATTENVAFPGGRRAQVIGGLFAAGSALALIGAPLRATDVSQRDLTRFYHAAQQLRQGISPYDVSAITGAGLAHAMQTGVLPLGYVYPPLLAGLLIPFTRLPIRTLFDAWTLVLAASIIGAILLFHVALTGRVSWRLIVIAIPLALLLRPVRDELNQGQIDALLLLSLAASLWAYQRGYIKRSALFLALPLAVKPFLGVVLLFYIWKGAYRLSAWTVSIAAALVLVPFFPLGIPGVAAWLTVSRFESSPNFAWIGFNQAPYGVAVRLFSPNPFTVPVAVAPWLAQLVMLATAAAILCCLARWIPRRSSPNAPSTAVEFVLVLLATALISPLTEPVHLTMLVAPLFALGVMAWRSRGQARWTISGALLLIYLVFTLPQVYRFTTLSQGRPHGLGVLSTSVWLWALVALWLTLAYAYRRLGEGAQSARAVRPVGLGSPPERAPAVSIPS